MNFVSSLFEQEEVPAIMNSMSSGCAATAMAISRVRTFDLSPTLRSLAGLLSRTVRVLLAGRELPGVVGAAAPSCPPQR